MAGREYSYLNLMNISDTGQKECKRARGAKPATVEKYRRAVELYATTRMSCTEICRICGVTVSGLQAHIGRYHRHLLLARNGIECSREEADGIKLPSFRRQKPATHSKYKKAIEACDNMDYIEMNISQIARMFGVDGTNLGRQLRTHYPEILEFRERTRLRLGVNDNLPRGSRSYCKEQYAKAVELLKSDKYITVQEAAEYCGVSYTGLEQHLLFYYKDLVERRIGIRAKALRRQRKGEITGRGTAHAPSPELTEKYAEAVNLYRTTPLSLAKIAQETGVSKKGFYEYLHRWCMDLVCQRRGISYEEGRPADFAKASKSHPAARAKYADAIRKLKESELPTAQVAAEYGLHPETFRSYLKEHEPELYARQGRTKAANGNTVSRRSMEKYEEAMRLYGTTTESVKSLARRFGFNDSAFGQFIRRNFPEVDERHRELVAQQGE